MLVKVLYIVITPIPFEINIENPIISGWRGGKVFQMAAGWMRSPLLTQKEEPVPCEGEALLSMHKLHILILNQKAC